MLLALGLQGHLGVLSAPDISNYLTQVRAPYKKYMYPYLIYAASEQTQHVIVINDLIYMYIQGVEALTVAVLIGISASKMGSADPFVSKTMCLHLPTLLPPMHSELDISSIVQSSALTGLGLLYCKTGNRLMTEFLLNELTKTHSTDKYDNRSVCPSMMATM